MEDTALRFFLAAKMSRMRYGDSYLMGRDVALKAWPPTGDHDRSFEGAFRAMALASGGNRPETSYTTQERIERDLDGTFEVKQSDIDGGWLIHRRVSACPHCRGTGFVRSFPSDSALPFFDPSASVALDEAVAIETRPCGHKPD